MKKLLSLLMVSMLVVSLAVPAFASDDMTYYNGLELPTIPVPSNPSNYRYIYLYNHVAGVIVHYADVAPVYDVAKNSASASNCTNTFAILQGGVWSALTSPAKGQVTFDGTPIWSNFDLYDTDGNLYMSASEPYQMCDGSICPANDLNDDGICDDCGRVLRMIALPDGWPSNFPAPPTSYDTNSQYILMTKDDGYTYLYVFTPYDASPVSEWNTLGSVHNSMQLKMFDASGNGVNVKRLTYRLSDDGEWYQHDSQSVDSTLFGDFEEIDMIYSTLSFYKEDGTLFFPLPLWAEVEKVTQGEMMTALAETLGTMKTLMVCGVGCLALLVVLSLFGKRSLISRG